MLSATRETHPENGITTKISELMIRERETRLSQQIKSEAYRL